jgi:hypothetical protein
MRRSLGNGAVHVNGMRQSKFTRRPTEPGRFDARHARGHPVRFVFTPEERRLDTEIQPRIKSSMRVIHAGPPALERTSALTMGRALER